MAHWRVQIYNSFQVVHNESVILQTSQPCLQSTNENVLLNNLNSHQQSSLGFFSELLKHSSSQMVSSSRPFWIPTLAIVSDQRWENKIWHLLTCIISSRTDHSCAAASSGFSPARRILNMQVAVVETCRCTPHTCLTLINHVSGWEIQHLLLFHEWVQPVITTNSTWCVVSVWFFMGLIIIRSVDTFMVVKATLLL